jgi:hypothetical protein
MGDPLTDGFHDSRKLVSLNHRVGGEGMLAMIHMDIRTADTDPADPQQDLTRTRDWLRNIPEFNLSRFNHDSLSHYSSSAHS